MVNEKFDGSEIEAGKTIESCQGDLMVDSSCRGLNSLVVDKTKLVIFDWMGGIIFTSNFNKFYRKHISLIICWELMFIFENEWSGDQSDRELLLPDITLLRRRSVWESFWGHVEGDEGKGCHQENRFGYFYEWQVFIECHFLLNLPAKKIQSSEYRPFQRCP